MDEINEEIPPCDTWFQHEALDRISMILSHIDFALGDSDRSHPGIHNDECRKLLSQATRNLANLYQKVGEWEPDDNR